jgi:3D (Asp-Asp-Asp) domain-containing protein
MKMQHRHPLLRTLALFVLCAASLTRADAQADAGSASRLAPVVARILSYERTLPTRAGGTVDILVIYANGRPASEAEARAYTAALSRIAGSTIQGLPLRVNAAAYSAAALQSAIGSGVDVIVVCGGLEGQVNAIAQATRARQVLTVGLMREHVQQATSIAVVLEDGRPKIVAHLGHARAEGMQFSSQLLRLSEVL